MGTFVKRQALPLDVDCGGINANQICGLPVVAALLDQKYNPARLFSKTNA
jgi:hypothetical protein